MHVPVSDERSVVRARLFPESESSTGTVRFPARPARMEKSAIVSLRIPTSVAAAAALSGLRFHVPFETGDPDLKTIANRSSPERYRTAAALSS